jgi:hypothetical protein
VNTEQKSAARQPSLQDSIVAYLRERPQGVASGDIAERFLRLKSPGQKIAAVAVAALLASDRRCFTDANGLWHAAAPAAGPVEPLQGLPWLAVFALTDPGERRVLYLALWQIAPTISCLGSGWLVDPDGLPFEEREVVQSSADPDYSREAAAALLASAALAAEKRIPVFISSTIRSLVVSSCAAREEAFTDDTMIARELMKAAEAAAPRSLTLDAFETAVLGAAQPGASARKQGERFAVALAELFQLLGRNGIDSREALDARLSEKTSFSFTGKSFTYNDLLALPPRPGVYGFKDGDGAYLYIGKSNNLKRRLLSYFGDTDESPAKLDRLRERACSMVAHPCGSELECLLHEYRLIRKHAPLLNRNVAVNERTGSFRPIADCIVLLPHVAPGKAMSVWFRENQKILLKSIELTFEEVDRPVIAELATFFFSQRLPATPSDFPEQEIASRWIRRHADSLSVVPVSRMACAEEIHDALRITLREFGESRSMPR